MNPQRSTSTKLISLRAPIISAPKMAKRISAYIPSAERRVNNHMNISKLRPRMDKGRVLGFVLAILASCRADDHKDSNRKKGNEHRPYHPNRFPLIGKKFWKQINDGNTQAVDGMEKDA